MTIATAARRIAGAPWIARAAAPLLILAIVWLASGTSALRGVDNRLEELRFNLLQRPASATLTVVEIDAASLAELDQWPWPRTLYAEAIERLDAAGANLIAFDVDFSARSDAANDAALERAIAHASGRVILPTFHQAATTARPSQIVETAPNAAFAEHALFANVNVVPGEDGVVRDSQSGFQSAEGYRPSVAGLLAGTDYGEAKRFGVDFGVDADTIPRLSFADVLAGRFDPELVRGRNILIGATALELGDEFVTPRYRIIPGVFVHALAYESLVQGRALERLTPLIALLAAAIVLAVLCRPGCRWSWGGTGVRQGGTLAILVLAPLALQAATPVRLDVAPALLAQALCLVCSLSGELHARAKELLEQRAASARHKALVALSLRDTHDGIIVTDDTGRIEVCNPQAAAFLGRPGRDLTGQRLADVAPTFKTYGQALAETSRGEPTASEKSAGKPARYLHAVAAERGTKAIEVTASRSSFAAGNDTDDVVIYTLHDVTARLRMLHAEAAAKKAAEEASTAKTRFIATMSHELRTPLNAVMGFSDSISNERYGPLGAPEYSEFARYIHESGERLLGIVNRVLEVARLDAGKITLNCMGWSVPELVDAACSRLKAKIDAKTVSIAVSGGEALGEIRVDPTLFQNVFDELIDNAVEFSPKGGRIDIEARREGVHDVVIEVRNSAVPIAPDVLATLTQPFVQADSSDTRAHDGAGLGLHLVERYMALHSGALELESAEDGVFTARLKLFDAVADKKASARAA